jgi:hypothetical protein
LALSLLCPTALLPSTLTHHDHKPDHPLEEFRTRDFHAGVEHTEAANTVWCKKYGKVKDGGGLRKSQNPSTTVIAQKGEDSNI